MNVKNRVEKLERLEGAGDKFNFSIELQRLYVEAQQPGWRPKSRDEYIAEQQNIIATSNNPELVRLVKAELRLEGFSE